MNRLIDVTDEFLNKSKPGLGKVTCEEGLNIKHIKKKYQPPIGF